MKRLIIRNLGPIKAVDIELKRVNLIIGPQSSGKSTVLKVACFCAWMERQIELTQSPGKYCEAQTFVNNLVVFHKLTGYMQSDSFIGYENDVLSFAYSAKEKQCSFSWKETKKWNYKRTKIAYVPSERNLVAAIPNWYQVSMNNDSILDFMKEWEFARRAFDKGERILDLPVEYKYNANNRSDKIVLENGKELDLTMASSGLQSLAPLFIMLRYLTSQYYSLTRSSVEQDMIKEHLKEVVSKELSGKNTTEQLKVVNSIFTPHHTDIYRRTGSAHIPFHSKEFCLFTCQYA